MHTKFWRRGNFLENVLLKERKEDEKITLSLVLRR
jgi:hypothetical protein